MRSLAFLLISLLLLSSCASGVNPLSLVDSDINEVWPKPPEKPRIKLIRSFAGAADLVEKKSSQNRLFRWLTGEMAEQIPFVAPYGIATDGEGVIWVSDPGAHAVHALDLKKRKARLWTLAGADFFVSPTGIYFDPTAQKIYVADSELKKIFVLSRAGQLVSQINPGKPFGRPGGIALDSEGNLLVADVLAGHIRRFSSSGIELDSIGSPTTPDGLFNRPIGLTVDREGRIYVIDSLNFRVEVLTASGKPVVSIGELGDQPGSLSRPRGVTVDSFGHIYIADAAFDNIQIFNLKGELLLVFGNGGKHGLSMPASLVSDSSGRIYAVDSFNHQIKIFQFLGEGD